jgi:hypothetical protein
MKAKIRCQVRDYLAQVHVSPRQRRRKVKKREKSNQRTKQRKYRPARNVCRTNGAGTILLPKCGRNAGVPLDPASCGIALKSGL